jgi:hypothetical protein
MSGNSVVGCIGSSKALVREYVHDFGLCSINITAVEDSLREHLRHRAMIRAEWHQKDCVLGVKATKLAKIEDAYSEVTLGGLRREFEQQGGEPDLVALLKKVTEGRNTLLHSHLAITDYNVMRVTTARIQEVREGLHALSNLAQRAYHAIQAEDLKALQALADRVRRDGMPDGPHSERLQMMLAEFEHMVQKNSTAKEWGPGPWREPAPVRPSPSA